MVNLIKKDFLLTFSNKQSWIIIIFFIPFIFLVQDFKANDRTALIAIYTLTYLLTIMPFSYEIKSKPHMLIQSLPTRKNEIVFSRYILILINYLFVIVYTVICLWIIELLGFGNVDSLNFSLVELSLPLVIVSLSIAMPLNFRLPPKTANIVSMILFIVIHNFLIMNSIDILLLSFVKGLGLPLLLAIIYFSSMRISLWLYETRDFV